MNASMIRIGPLYSFKAPTKVTRDATYYGKGYQGILPLFRGTRLQFVSCNADADGPDAQGDIVIFFFA